MKYSVDRIEGETAILEDENMVFVSLKKDELPAGIKEGNVVEFDGEKYIRSYEEEKLRKKRIFEKQQKLLKKKWR